MSQEYTREDDTQSLTPSVTQYPREYGRTYHSYHEGRYVYPNDERELNRMDMQHHMCKLLMGERLFFAPVISPRMILDIGTGTGIWPIEISSIFPDAKIKGTDLSPCQPNEVPENVEFIVDDITEDEWLWNRNSIDYIHSGHLSGSLPSYKELQRKMYSHLRPGGWAEIHEFDTMVKCDDGTMPPMDESSWSAYKLQDWCEMQIDSGLSFDPQRQFRVAHRLARGMKELGFVDVQERIFKAPVNPWPADPHLRNIGKWMESNLLEGLSGWSYKPFRNLGYSPSEIEMFLVEVRKNIQDRRVHAYFNFHVVELLASTFRRFVNGQQRRFESRVPGPLEARRRLDKRRNTALASAAGFGPGEDIACLLGKNGKEHMKWSEPGKSFDYQFASPAPPPPPMSFYNEDLNAFEFQSPLQGRSDVQERPKKIPRDQFFKETNLRKYRTTIALRDALRHVDIDLRQEPSYSRLLFDRLTSRRDRLPATQKELISFLDDPHLNVPGAENYLRVMELYYSGEAPMGKQHPLFGTVLRAVKLGSISPKEMAGIINRIADLTRAAAGDKAKNGELLTRLYERLWHAIGKCDVYGHQDLDEPMIDTWLGALFENGTADDFCLAKEILLAADCDVSFSSSWLSEFLTRWFHDADCSNSELDAEYIIEFLRPFHPDVVSDSLISVTEGLLTSNKTHLLGTWGSCLAGLHNASAIASSRAWTHIRVHHDGTSSLLFNHPPTSPRHLIIQRLWILYMVKSSMIPHQVRSPGSVNPTIKSLYRMYESARRDSYDDLWTSLTKGIQDLDLPFDLEAMAEDLRTGRNMSATMRQTLQRHSHLPLTFEEIFKDIHTFNSARAAFLPNMARLINRIDITSPGFREHAIHLARTGNTLDVWNLIRILRMHTPAKIALSFSWKSPANFTDQSLVTRPRRATEPDPDEVLDIIHALAAAFACSPQISPRRAFQLVHWLYSFVVRHGGPIRPPLAYGRVSVIKAHYIWRIVEQVEGPEALGALMGQAEEVGCSDYVSTYRSPTFARAKLDISI
ncbi:class I SAM-dependent methyltransferase [Aspergillus undulatus]|uniref:class I SAM-dependent methyltransferase n=1 Tax=Aspergillus undulatus TaxID=1810928 RepID=UPI003CCE1428